MEEKEIITKKKLGTIPKIIIGIILIIGSFYIYMRLIEPTSLTIKDYGVIDNKIPESFNGFKIVQFSDIHFGRTTNEKEVKNIVQKINELKPDILIFTGDLFNPYITLSENNKNFLKEALKETKATLKKFAITGEQDYIDISSFKEIFEYSGFKILENENIPIYYKGTTPIYISGIPEQDQDIIKALTKEEEAYQILIAHKPNIFDKTWNNTNLVLTGHTLGGLINIPGIGGLIRLEDTNNYHRGKYTRGSSTLYVSNGIGTDYISMRFLNTPSITIYRLYNS